MSNALAGLEPSSLWSHFASIAAIPRPSKHEEQIATWIRTLAERSGFGVQSDRVGNLVIDVPASAGFESGPTIILQGHLDMVCEKNSSTAHDFMRDPIVPRLAGDWVTASGTTLGADNGIGVAAALAAATDPAVSHGPLQLLFTVDEETGLSGAAGLNASLLSGRTLLNLDSEEDGILFVGCAGGIDTHLLLEPQMIVPTAGNRAYRVRVCGLRGGHSGLNIHQNRGNAIKLLSRLLIAALESGIGIELASLRGGSMRNAIPREADALIFLSDNADRFRAVLGRCLKDLRAELANTDEGLEIHFDPSQHEGRAMDNADRNRLLQLLMAVPNGPLAMSNDIPGLVETSNCLSVVDSHNDRLRIVAASRSSVSQALENLATSIRAIGALAGAEVKTHDGYPGWRPDLDSVVLGVMRGVYTDVWGASPTVTAVHAGLECGILGQMVPGLEMISFGPQIEGAHSPAERVSVSSVAKFWEALKLGLERLGRSQRAAEPAQQPG